VIPLDDARILAPMADYTDGPFRRLCKRHGADVLVTEMVPVQALLRSARARERLLPFEPWEAPIGVQLSLGTPDVVDEALAMLADKGFAFVDLNAGCPMRTTVNGGCGAALLREPARLEEILRRMVKGAAPTPVTVKVRSGWCDGEYTVLEVARRAEQAGVSAITVHPRTREQMYRGKADWSWIARVKEVVGIPVVGNGDVQCEADAQRMRAETGCDAVMIGRAAVGNPWVFERTPAVLTERERVLRTVTTARAHFEESLPLARNPRYGVVVFRKHLARYLKGIPHSREHRIELLGLTDPDAMRRAFDAFESEWREGPHAEEGQ
jgi:tRNA-dihydrouridine synthase B